MLIFYVQKPCKYCRVKVCSVQEKKGHAVEVHDSQKQDIEASNALSCGQWFKEDKGT